MFNIIISFSELVHARFYQEFSYEVESILVSLHSTRHHPRYCNASSSDMIRGFLVETVWSLFAERTFVACFAFVKLIVKSLSRVFSPTTIPA